MNQHTGLMFTNVSFRYPDGIELFNNLSFSLNTGEFYLIKGPSGTGKSTLLRLMNRLEEPSGGEIIFNGTPISDIPAPEFRRSVLYIQQTPVVTDGTVKENLLLPFRFKHNRTLAVPDDSKLFRLLEDFSLINISLDTTARNLSVGQQQRLCLIRGLLLSPEIILLDEPTSALDDESSRIVEKTAEKLSSLDGKTVVMVSHREFRPDQLTPSLIELNHDSLAVTHSTTITPEPDNAT